MTAENSRMEFLEGKPIARTMMSRNISITLIPIATITVENEKIIRFSTHHLREVSYFR